MTFFLPLRLSGGRQGEVGQSGGFRVPGPSIIASIAIRRAAAAMIGGTRLPQLLSKHERNLHYSITATSSVPRFNNFLQMKVVPH